MNNCPSNPSHTLFFLFQILSYLQWSRTTTFPLKMLFATASLNRFPFSSTFFSLLLPINYITKIHAASFTSAFPLSPALSHAALLSADDAFLLTVRGVSTQRWGM